MPMPLLAVQDLKLDFLNGGHPVRVLDGVSFTVSEGDTVCLVGESGSGKSVTALSLARLLPSPPATYVGGSILLEGRDVLLMRKRALREIRGKVISYVFQDPGAALNPVFRIGHQILETLRLHQPAHATEAEVIRLLSLVGIPAPDVRLRDYPHQISGGMQQRIVIAMAIASRPKLLIADEPTTALDVTIQAQILDLLIDLKSKLGMSILLITHNLGLVRDFADRVLVMYAGQIVEEGPALELFRNPLHPYTRALISSVPRIGANHERLLAIPGTVPQPGRWPSGCRFHPRCIQRQEPCDKSLPLLLRPVETRAVRCPFWDNTSP
jgi:oligopeptide/dipeptide ABC transporter ATP-binding protein